MIFITTLCKLTDYLLNAAICSGFGFSFTVIVTFKLRQIFLKILINSCDTKLRYKKADGRMYYHLLQAFHPDENLTPETAHEIALRFAEENFPGYEVLVATHVDRNHIHSHLVINSVNAESGYKYHSDNKRSLPIISVKRLPRSTEKS